MSQVFWSQPASHGKCLEWSHYRQLPMGNVPSDLITGSFPWEMSRVISLQPASHGKCPEWSHYRQLPKRNASINLITDSFPQEMPQVISLQAVSCRNCLLLSDCRRLPEGRSYAVILQTSFCHCFCSCNTITSKHCPMQSDYCLIFYWIWNNDRNLRVITFYWEIAMSEPHPEAPSRSQKLMSRKLRSIDDSSKPSSTHSTWVSWTTVTDHFSLTDKAEFWFESESQSSHDSCLGFHCILKFRFVDEMYLWHVRVVVHLVEVAEVGTYTL